MNSHVKIWTEEVVIPTYPVGQPDRNPMFLEKRVYQGSSGVVYPHPVIDKIMDEKTDQSYTAVFLENEYLKIMVLPQLGGRIQMAYDKVKERHFVYYNQVIKPALVGLTGPWISGGIEFNWPQHHRPSTFDPVDFTIIENENGSVTCWVNEVELIFRTKGMAGFTLYPGKAYLEITAKLYNRTPFPQTFLWWANPAVKVNDYYQSIFPPDVYAVFDHGRRDVSSFPIAKGTYYKVDYAPGTDISRYCNIPVPTSYMAGSSDYDFIGGYEHDSGGGLLHVADHHVSPGKKQWTWGHGEFGQAWDRNLTDEDGPYIELMTGVFTDNQPDFSWIQPFEQKEFVQYFMPYREVGVVKNATKEAAVGLEANETGGIIRIHFTSFYGEVEVQLRSGAEVLYCTTVQGAPDMPFVKEFPWPHAVDVNALLVEVRDLQSGRLLVAYNAQPPGEKELPPAAVAARKPAEVELNEQLFLTGQHIEQYRHATYNAADYYEEALRRDPGDIRCSNAMGLLFLRKARPDLATPYLHKAIATATYRNPNPYDSECYYNLGWALLLQDKTNEAYDAFYKATWSQAWQHAGFLNLARIAAGRLQWDEALQLAEQSLVRNWHSHTARHLKAAILRKAGRAAAAAEWGRVSLELDPFNYGCLYEQHLIDNNTSSLDLLLQRSRNWMHTMLEYALDYVYAGMLDEASGLLQLHMQHTAKVSPLCYYYLAWIAGKQGEIAQAKEFAEAGHKCSHEYCFPHRVEDALALQYVLSVLPHPKTWYYLGNLWYDKRLSDDAVHCWEESIALGADFATVYRNLSLAMYNKRHHPSNALALMEKAFQLDDTDARVLMELDQLYKKVNRSAQKRLDHLDEYMDLVVHRDELYLEYVTLLNQLGRYQEAASALASHVFHPWEGGEGKVTGQYLVAHLELARQHIATGDAEAALGELALAERFPHNLGEGKLYGAPENDLFFLRAEALSLAGNDKEARQWWAKAAEGSTAPVQAIFYNDPQPDKILYRGLAWARLGEQSRAEKVFRLIDFSEQHQHDHIEIDYFAVSLPDLLVFDADLDLKNRLHCLYMAALGYLGLALTGQSQHNAQAATLFDRVLSIDAHHSGALLHRQLLRKIDIESVN
ncbi:DUF5107 domain-containing protein [Chitinophaga sedimenti]|uniref:DUF5107 domain-containing protein n=1 Tax=Chitinophaga sedimenti TaxID=2033606 RepID=UPI0020031073|nr:DUF5107 domain-containing protein [Chitinophaga sedimenti]MCK7555918.1 DUF5107 domain-containing protein [Chitinophaga sedimenti]